MGWGEPIHPRPWPPEVQRAARVLAAAVRRWREHPSTLHAEQVGEALDLYDRQRREST